MEQPQIRLSTIDDNIAREKGRLLAAQAIAHNPEQRKAVEEKFGQEYCKHIWPEAYAKSPFFSRLIDRMKFVRL